jgi:1,4-alpha-glucan branching enzyme
MSRRKQSNKTKKRRITFKLEASGAKDAVLVGDFNSWDVKKHRMKRDDKGRWTKIVTLSPGRYEYKFLVDGEWHNDPHNDLVVPNSFGTINNILTV